MNISTSRSEEWRVKSEEWKVNVENRLRFSSFSFISSLLSLISPNSVWRWSVWMDSNHRPRAYQARALTTWATNRYSRVSDSSHLTRVNAIGNEAWSFLWTSPSLAVGTADWWRWWDSNPWPPACRAGALPTELHPHTTGSFLFKDHCRSLKIEQQKIRTQPSVYRPRRLVWQNRDILSRSP